MDISAIQSNLNGLGYGFLVVDGDLGPLTFGAILNYCAQSKPLNTVQIGAAMAVDFPNYQINTALRMSHFIGQAAHETGGFLFLTELGSPSYFSAYDFRANLGNNAVGDGSKYRGRGLFQITGVYNYTLYGTRLGIDLLDNPLLAAQPDNATATACLFWTDHDLNTYADADDCLTITKRINGGTNGLVDRQALTDRMKALLSA